MMALAGKSRRNPFRMEEWEVVEHIGGHPYRWDPFAGLWLAIELAKTPVKVELN